MTTGHRSRTTQRVFGRVAVAPLVATVIATAAAGSGSASSAASFRLVFDGRHNDALLHEGPFTTSASFCPLGYAAYVSIDSATETAVRKFTCSGFQGDFSATPSKRTRVLRLRIDAGDPVGNEGALATTLHLR